MSVLSTTQSARLLCISRHLQSSATSQRNVQSKTIGVYDANMHYIDTENNAEHAVVFLHGNPTSSFLWRNIIPHVSGIARCLAPDLIGMGKSSKVKGLMYTYDDHFKYLSKWMDSVNLPKKVNLVVHDWGSGLGFHWANLNSDKVASITHMESLVNATNWDSFPDLARSIFQALRSPGGDEMVLEKNLFVELLLPRSILRKLTDNEMAAYVEPFKQPGEDRRPTLTWPREIPIYSDGPENVVKYAESWNKYLANSSSLPKLYIHGDPGFFSAKILETTKDWPNQRIVTVKGLHFLQEDSPNEIGKAIKDFLVKDVF